MKNLLNFVKKLEKKIKRSIFFIVDDKSPKLRQRKRENPQIFD